MLVQRNMNNYWKTPVRFLRGVGEARAGALARLEILTTGDLLEHYPLRYEDRRCTAAIGQLEDGQVVSIYARVEGVNSKKIRSGLQILTVHVTDGSGTLALTFFNQQFREKQFTPGIMVSAYGKVERNRFGVSMNSPEYELFDESDHAENMGIVAVYRMCEGITGKYLRKIIAAALAQLPKHERLPKGISARYALMPLQRALQTIHQPSDMNEIVDARRRLIFDEFFALQSCILMHRSHIKARSTAIRIGAGALVDKYLAMLSFQLTNGQQQAWRDIKQDMLGQSPMERLIQGDVGSGKTVIAALSILAAVDSGYQATLMAPTEVLATQHYAAMQDDFGKLGVDAKLLTSRIKDKKNILKDISINETDVVIGTHALIQDDVKFAKLGLVITDEQHRFGVEQRSALRAKGENPHMLVMTATPIPRTLALSLYGDMDISSIRELPPGRKPVKTYLRDSIKRQAVYDFARQQITAGRQVFVVCPLIEDSEKLQTQSAKSLFEELSGSYFRDVQCVLMHGQLKSSEKESAMQSFVANASQVMVATTVIEVGINVPNANLMIIEGADRFGLSQLHQLRGRVGRGSHRSYCVLISDSRVPDTLKRLNAFTECNDGFDIADMDLQFRGAGQFFGFRQHGLGDLKIGDLLFDYKLMIECKNAVGDVLQSYGGNTIVENYLKNIYNDIPQLLKN